MDEESEQVSNAMYRRSQLAIAGMLGLHGPIQGAIARFDFLKRSADAAGVSIGQLLATALPGLAAIATASKVISEAIGLAKEADEAWQQAGLSAQGFFNNLAIGYGIKEIPKISGILDFKAEGLAAVEQRLNRVKSIIEELTHQATPEERARAALRPDEESLAAKKTDLGAITAQRQKLSDEIAGLKNLPGSKELAETFRARFEELGRDFSKKSAEIRAAQETLDKKMLERVKEELYAEEEGKARQAALAGREDEATRIRAAITAARSRDVVPGSAGYEDVLARQAGAEAERQRAIKRFKEQGIRDARFPETSPGPVAQPSGPVLPSEVAERFDRRLESFPESARTSQTYRQIVEDKARAVDRAQATLQATVVRTLDKMINNGEALTHKLANLEARLNAGRTQ